MNQLLNQIVSFPWYVWGFLVVLFLFLVRDRKEWRYQVEFKQDQGNGSGDITIAKYHRTEPDIDVELKLDEKHRKKRVEIFIEKHLVFVVPEEKNSGNSINYRRPYDQREPPDNGTVEVVIEKEVVFSGVLKAV